MTDYIERGIASEFERERVEHVLVTASADAAQPCVIIFPTVMGVSELELGFARRLADKGRTALVADLFGKRFTPVVDRQEAFAAMTRLREDRASLRRRLVAVLETARAQAEIDGSKVAAIGFCFGGQCALDLARSGADIAGIASFHGLFDPPGLDPLPIKAKVAAYHGWEDPMVPPEAVVALGNELTEADADWQIHAYGHVAHGFTNPKATELGIEGVRYNEAAARRSWAALEDFLSELFG
jgi:dienelactone hydrolase